VFPRTPSASTINFAEPVHRGVATPFSSTVSAGDSPAVSCKWDWGDGTTTGPAACSPGSLSQAKTYSTTGVRLITLTVTGSTVRPYADGFQELKAPGRAFLAKPFTVEQLTDTLASVLA
jgi:hypothetical protein